jgi:hypothetical protein
MLSASGFRFSGALGVPDVDAFTSVSGGHGRIDFAAISLLDTASLFGIQDGADLVLGQLLFDTIGAGSSILRFDTFAPPGAWLVGSDPFGSLPVTGLGTALINVSESHSVPEPGTLWLTLAAAAGFTVFRRRARLSVPA